MPQKTIRDPVHGNISLTLPEDQVIVDLMDTPEFQRLRRIKQLGTAYLTYPGAEHSRFTHALGTFHLMTVALNQLEQTAPNAAIKKVIAAHRMEARIAALLHDLGHGPFSHSFEKLVGLHTRSHEAWTKDIILGPSEIQQVLKRYKIQPENIVAILSKTFPHPLFSELISGHLDVDRMDYLLRDSHNCGVRYGMFDWERVVSALTLYEKKGTYHLAFRLKGRHALEAFILARYFMYEQVYNHKTVLGTEFLLKMILKRAHDLVKTKKLTIEHPALKKLFSGRAQHAVPLHVNDYLALDDHVLTTAFNEWTTSSDPILSDLTERFLSRRLFKAIEVDRSAVKQVETIKVRAKKHDFDPMYYIDQLDESLSAYPPYEPRTKTEVHELMIEDKGVIRPLSEISPIIKNFKHLKFALTKICFPKELDV